MTSPVAETKPAPPPRARRWVVVALVVLGVVALYGVIGSFLVPVLVKKIAAEKIGERLGRTVTIDNVSVNPYKLTGKIEGLKILEGDGKATFVSFDALDVNGSATSFYRFAPVVDELTLTGLKVSLVRDGESHFNLTDIVDRLARLARDAPKTEKKDEARFSISNIRVVNAAIDFDDRPKGAKHQVKEMSITIPFVSNLPSHLKEYVQPSFSANVNGSAFQLAGETLPFEDSLATRVNVDLKGLDLRRYVGYSPAPLPVTLDSGLLDARIAVRFTQGANKHATVDVSGTAALRELALSTAEGKLAQVRTIEADLASFDPLGGKAKVNSIRVSDAAAMDTAWRVPSLEARGIALDLNARTAVIEAVATRDAVLAIKRRRDGTIEVPHVAMQKAEPETPAAPWNVSVAKVSASGYKLTILDSAMQPALTHRITVASVEATGLSTDNGFKGAAVASIALDRGGTLDVDTTFALDPMEVSAKLDARKLDLIGFRPYFAQFPTVAVTGGGATAKGTLTLRGKPQALHVAYKGTAEIAKFAANETESKEELLSWNSFKTSGIDFDMPAQGALTLGIGEIVIDKVYSKIVVLPDGKLNVQKLRVGAVDEPATPPAEPRPRNVRIDRVAFVDGRLNFTDLFIRPNYAADVGELNGTVTNLSSEPESRAVVDLKGSYDKSAPVVIAGTVNPLRGDLFLDIGAKGTAIELPSFTAYSARYAGYGITAGKLTLDVKYHVEGGKLDGRNRILVEQLTFGDKVEGPDATKLPVLFAVNLLKDSQGRINLELPVTGSLADPQFAIGALVTQVLGNLFKTAITSPFSLLAGAFGGGTAAGGKDSGDLAFVDFAPGASDISPAGEKKMETLVKALQDRPAIKMDVVGHSDPTKDLTALKMAALQRKLAGSGAKPGEKVTIDPAAYPRLVKAAYTQEKLARPAEKGASEKAASEKAAPPEPTTAEMEAALLERIVVGDEELRALAQRRAEAVQSFLVQKGRLEADRVALATTVQTPAADKGNSTRVDFALR